MPADPRTIAEEALRLAEGATPGPWFSGAWRADEVRHRPAEAWCNRCGEMRRWVTTDRAPQECSVCGSEECGASPEPIVRCIEDGTEADAAMIAHAGTHYATLARAYLALVSDLPVVIEAARRYVDARRALAAAGDPWAAALAAAKTGPAFAAWMKEVDAFDALAASVEKS